MLGSPYLWLLTDKWRSVKRLARACLAADPGKPGAARSTRGRASTAKIAGLVPKEDRLQGLFQLRARRPPPPLPRARPARPGRPPRRSSSPSGSCSATRAGRQWLGRLRGRPRARPIAARRSQPQPPGSVLLRCPHLLQLSSARSGSRAGRRGRGGGGSGKGVLAAAPGPGHSVEPGGRGLKRGRPELRASSLCARLPPRRAEPRGPWGGGGAGAGRAACVGRGPGAWGSPSSRSQISGRRRRRRYWKQLLAVACARSSTATSWGFWAAGGAARSLELVESTGEPPQEPAGRSQALLILHLEQAVFRRPCFVGFQMCQPTYPCLVVKALGGSGHGGQEPAPSPADLSLERLGVRATILHFNV